LLLYTKFDYKTGLFEEKQTFGPYLDTSRYSYIQYVEFRYIGKKVKSLRVVCR